MTALRLRSAHRRGTLARTVALGCGLVRTVAGVGLLARPETFPRALGVDSVTATRVGWLTRIVAGRELALGAGTLHALATGRPLRPWLLAQAVSDAADAGALLLAVRDRQVSPPRALAVVAVAAMGVAGEVLAGDHRRADTAG